jgi:hypothetical protein
LVMVGLQRLPLDVGASRSTGAADLFVASI